MLEGGGPPLGILAMAPFNEQTIQLGGGDLLVLYSDGVTECLYNGQEEEFGEGSFHRRAAPAPRETGFGYCGRGDQCVAGVCRRSATC